MLQSARQEQSAAVNHRQWDMISSAAARHCFYVQLRLTQRSSVQRSGRSVVCPVGVDSRLVKCSVRPRWRPRRGRRVWPHASASGRVRRLTSTSRRGSVHRCLK